MNPFTIAGVTVVNLALLAYSVGIFSEQRHRRVSRFAVTFLTWGVVLDVTATTCMILGSSHGPFTLHGLLGFSSLTAMVLETVFARRHRRQAGDGEVPRWLHLYSRVAYVWWIAAYFTGAYLVMSSR